jgi:hypothetical protein
MEMKAAFLRPVDSKWERLSAECVELGATPKFVRVATRRRPRIQGPPNGTGATAGLAPI